LIVWKGKLYFNREDVDLLKEEEKYVRKRYEAVTLCLQPASPMTRSEAAERYGVSERTIKRWIKRYRTAGIPGLRKNSTRPKRIKRKVTPQDETLIVELRRRTGFGPRRIWWLLKASRVNQPHKESYSPTTIRNVLIRTGTVKVRKRERRSFNSFDWEKPLKCAQMDLTELDDQPILIVLDDHSRRRWGTVLEEATDDQIYDWMDGNVPEFEHLLTDNGTQMDRMNRRAGRYCAEHGTKHI
jgi:transposase